MRRSLFLYFLVAALVVTANVHLAAQETRATLLGRVVDATGGVIPGVSLTATNLETNVATPSVTNDEGLFRIPFLIPGQYEVKAEMTGFKTTVRRGITLSVNSEVNLDLVLELGEMSQSVTVTASEPVLNTTSASVGQVIDNRRVMELPLMGNSAMLMSGLAPGMQRSDDGFKYIALHSTIGASAYQTSGGVGGNEWSMDGTPNTGQSRRNAYLPYSDAVDEFRVETTSFDARIGHTTGAFITMQSKAGTNQFHGTLTESHWQQRWNATPNNDNGAYWKRIHEAEAAGNYLLADQLRDQERQATGRSNNYAASIGGPIKIPKLFDGKDKLFFFFIFNGFKDAKTEEPGSKIFSVPTEAERQGDFSARLLSKNASKYIIYDPLTTVFQNGVYTRTPFPNNIIPASRIVNPMYKFYEKLYPLPNHPPGEDPDTFANNYFNPNVPWNWDYKAFQNRVDYIMSERDKFFFRWSYNKFVEDRQDWTAETARGLHSNGLTRINKGVGADWVHTFSPTDVLHVATAYNRYVDNGINLKQREFKPSDVGLPAYLDEKAGDYHNLPIVNFTDYETAGRSYGKLLPISVATLTADYSKYFGKHSLTFGWDGRQYYRVGGAPGVTSGRFEFRNNLLKASSQTQADEVGTLGLEWAAFLMGIPSNMYVNNNDSFYITTPYQAVYVQDNFRLTPRLTLNFGARVEYEGSIRERFNRGLRDWNFNYALPENIVDTFVAGYQKVALPQRTVQDFGSGLHGGMNYLGYDGSARTTTSPTTRLMPRFGFAYKLNDRTVIRGGYGMYFDTLNVTHTAIDQSGYSRNTSTIVTNDNGISWNAGDPANGIPPVADPFPIRADESRFDTPLGNSLGHLARLGQGVQYLNPDYDPIRQQRWRLEIERELFSDAVVSVAYAGAWADKLGVTINANPVPAEFWTSGNVRDESASKFLSTAVPNPFLLSNFAFLQTENPALYQQLSTQGFFTNKTIQYQQLLRPYPHVNGNLKIDGVPIGANQYHAMLLRFEKRMSHGWTLNTHYEFSHSRSRDWVATADLDQRPSWRENDNSRPHRWVATSIYELPFGAGRQLLDRNGWLNTVFGGWQLGLIWQMQSGETIDFANLFFYGDTRDIRLASNEQTKDRWFNNGWDYPTGDPRNIDPATGEPYPNKLWQTDARQTTAGFHRNVFPNRFNWVRTDQFKQLDANIQKAFRIKEGVRALFRVDMLNAANHQVMGNPNTDPTSGNFGKVATYVNTPRYIQFQLRLQY
ncbi:MAG: carboxypeptidase regulatory-like domain-containing protein [Acidobacteriota bacterium]